MVTKSWTQVVKLVLICSMGVLINQCRTVADKSVQQDETESSFLTYDSAAVVTAHPIATKVGYDILRSGGNAYDAAVAVQFALAVCYPRAGNIGGGGFMVYRGDDGSVGSLDFREKAPLAASKDMYLDDQGNIIAESSKKGMKSAGVPGTVDGMWQIHQKFGLLSWKQILQPAMDLASKGCVQTAGNINSLNQVREDMMKANNGYCLYAPEKPLVVGDNLINIDLYQTLNEISENGADGFYSGDVADKLVAESNKGNGLITHEDLKQYNAVWRKPLQKELGAYNVISMGPPSSGGLAVIQLLKGSDMLNMDRYPHNSATAIHLMTELKKRVYADRSTWLGDPDFFEVPTDSLMSDDYLTSRFKEISKTKVTPSQEIKTGSVKTIESYETTHFSILDEIGNAVSITTTLNSNFGSKIIVEGAGFILNNEMDDFSIKPGVPNQFGLVGGVANAIEPEKRMLSSMSPTIVEKNGALWMILGTPGGSTIITNVYQNIQNVKDYGMCMQEAVDAGKVHSQWLPEIIHYEKGRLDTLTLKQLKNMGYELAPWSQIGLMEAILIHEDGSIEAAADTTRGEDKAMGY